MCACSKSTGRPISKRECSDGWAFHLESQSENHLFKPTFPPSSDHLFSLSPPPPLEALHHTPSSSPPPPSSPPRGTLPLTLGVVRNTSSLRRSVRNVVSVWREQDAQRVPEIQSLLIHFQLSLVEALRGALTDISFSAPPVLVKYVIESVSYIHRIWLTLSLN